MKDAKGHILKKNKVPDLGKKQGVTHVLQVLIKVPLIHKCLDIIIIR